MPENTLAYHPIPAASQFSLGREVLVSKLLESEDEQEELWSESVMCLILDAPHDRKPEIRCIVMDESDH